MEKTLKKRGEEKPHILIGTCLLFGILAAGLIVSRKKEKPTINKQEMTSQQYTNEDICQKLEDVKSSIKIGERIQLKWQLGIFFLTFSGALLILAFSYYPSLLNKVGLDTVDFYTINFSGFIGLAVTSFIIGTLFILRAKNKPLKKK